MKGKKSQNRTATAIEGRVSRDSARGYSTEPYKGKSEQARGDGGQMSMICRKVYGAPSPEFPIGLARLMDNSPIDTPPHEPHPHNYGTVPYQRRGHGYHKVRDRLSRGGLSHRRLQHIS